MMFRVHQYMQYLWKSKNRFGVHSPFLFDFLETVMKCGDTCKNDMKIISSYRQGLCSDRSTIDRLDLGGGGEILQNKSLQIRTLAKKHAISPYYGRMLYGIARKYQPQQILELGTSLGISTSYLGMACPGSSIISIEGCPATHARAGQHPLIRKHSGIRLICGNFDSSLKEAAQQMGRIDLAFIDGNHRKAPTIRYYETLLPFTHNDSIVIFDDIHHSREMLSAWDEIRENKNTRLSVDLFQFGIVFFKKEMSPGHFMLRFS